MNEKQTEVETVEDDQFVDDFLAWERDWDRAQASMDDLEELYERLKAICAKEAMRERDEARAEVERLRPLAAIGEAVERLDAWVAEGDDVTRVARIHVMTQPYTVELLDYKPGALMPYVERHADTIPATVDAIDAALKRTTS